MLLSHLPATFETDNWLLRAPRECDAPSLFRTCWGSELAATYRTTPPLRRFQEAEVLLNKALSSWPLGRERVYVLTRMGAPNTAIGTITLSLTQPTTAEVDYTLSAEFWGANLLHEALRAVTDAFLGLPNGRRAQAHCPGDSITGLRAFHKAGFQCEALVRRHAVLPHFGYEPADFWLFSRTGPDIVLP